MMNKNQVIKEALIRQIAELQNHLENTKKKYATAKLKKDAVQVVTYRLMKFSIDRKIKEVAEVLKEIEIEITKQNFPNNEFIKVSENYYFDDVQQRFIQTITGYKI